MQYFTKAHSMFAWAGFYCLIMFVACLLFGDPVADYLYSIAGKSGLAGIFLAIVLSGLATSLSTGLVAWFFAKEPEKEPANAGAANKLPM